MSLRRFMIYSLKPYAQGLIDAFKIKLLTIYALFESESCLKNVLDNLNNHGVLDTATFILTANGYNENYLYPIKGIFQNVKNYCSYSNTIMNPKWTFQAATLSLTSNTGPLGESYSYAINEVVSAFAHQTSNLNITNNDFLNNSTGYVTFSVYMKKNVTADIMQIFLQGGSAIGNPHANFNINTGSVTFTNGPITASIINASNGWWRCIVTVQPVSGFGSIFATINLVNNDPNAARAYGYAGTPSVSVLLANAQWEIGTVATSYQNIETTFYQASGNAEIIRNTVSYRTNSLNKIEELSQNNIIPYSNYFPGWSNINCFYSIGQDYDGNTGFFIINRSGASHRTQLATSSYYTLTDAVPMIFSIYVKNVNNNATTFSISNNSAFTGISATYNLSTGVATPGISATATMTNEGNGWWKCSIYSTTGFGNIMFNSNAPNPSAGVAVCKAQVVRGTTLLQFFPTYLRTNIPRIDYEEDTCPSILLEQTVSNTLLRSEEFDNASWNKNGINVTANTLIGPNNVSYGDTLIATMNDGYISQNSNTSTSFARTNSIFLMRKTGTGNIILELGRTTKIVSINSTDWTRVYVADSGLQSNYSIVSGTHTVTTPVPHNLITGDNVRFNLLTTTSGSGATNTGVSSVTVTSSTTFTFVFGSSTATGTCNIFSNYFRLKFATSGDEVYAWGAQGETQSSSTVNGYYPPTSYIPTTTAIVSKTTDNLSISNLISNNIIGNTWSIFLNIKKIGGSAVANSFFKLSNIMDTNSFYLSGLPLSGTKNVSGVTSTILTTSVYQPSNTDYFKILITCNNGIIDIWADGSKLISNSHTNYSELSLLSMGNNDAYGTIKLKLLSIWNKILSSTEIDYLFEYPFHDIGFTPVNYELQQIINRAYAEGFTLPSNTKLGYCDTLITEMKNNGVWQVSDLFLNFAYNDISLSNFARINWKNPYGGLGLAYTVNTVTYQNDGFRGDGVSGYINTQYNPVTSGIKYTANDACRFITVSPNSNIPNNGKYIESPVGGSVDCMTLKALGSNVYYINSPNSLTTLAILSGLMGVIRYSATLAATVAKSNYGTASNAVTGHTNAYRTLLNGGGSITNTVDATVTNYFCGGSLTNTQIQDFRTYYNAFLVSNGLTAFA